MPKQRKLFVVIVVRPWPVFPVVTPWTVVPAVTPRPIISIVTSVVAILTTCGRIVVLFKNRAAPIAELRSISP